MAAERWGDKDKPGAIGIPERRGLRPRRNWNKRLSAPQAMLRKRWGTLTSGATGDYRTGCERLQLLRSFAYGRQNEIAIDIDTSDNDKRKSKRSQKRSDRRAGVDSFLFDDEGEATDVDRNRRHTVATW